MRIFVSICAFFVATSAQAGSYGPTLEQRCADASGYSARDRASAGYTAPTDAERAYIADCVAQGRGTVAVRERVVVAGATSVCPPWASLLYRGTLYCPKN